MDCKSIYQDHTIRQEQYWYNAGYTNAQAFYSQLDTDVKKDISDTCTTFQQCHSEPPGHGILTYDATLVTDLKDKNQTAIFDKGTVMEIAEKMRSARILADFETKMFKDTASSPIGFDETYKDIRKNEDFLLLLHQKYGHIPMVQLQRMVSLGMLPARIQKCPLPICSACIYGKMTRRAWRSKPSNNKDTSKVATFPGEIVSVDQLESPIGGFIAKMKGKLYQKARYKCATVFVDHFSGLSFVFLQQSTTAKETLQAKAAFEQYADTFGVKVIHYHADNGRFAEKVWKEDIEKQFQTLTFSGAVLTIKMEEPKSALEIYRIKLGHH